MSKIAIVGCDASGKTVLISSLSDYYKAGSHANQSCIMVPADGVTRRYTDNLHRVMRINGEWPEATSDIVGGTSLKWKMLRMGTEIADVELLDFGGENFRYAFRNDGASKNPEVVARLKDYITSADFIVITVSMDKMLRNLTPTLYRELENGDIEYDRDSEAQWVTSELLRLLPDKVSANPPGVIVALTQADKHREELEKHGSAKAIFAKCWPTVTAMYPNLCVVPCASIDRMSANGRPADGYSTDGVLAVMREFARYAFGDRDSLCKRLDALQSLLSGSDETSDPKAFVTAVADYRKAFEAFGNTTAIVGEISVDKLAQCESFLANIRAREEVAAKAEATRAQKEMARPAKQGRVAPSLRIGSQVRMAVLLAILAVALAIGVKWLPVWSSADDGRTRPPAAPQSQADETAAREREKAERERLRLENEKAEAEQKRVREEALRQAEAHKRQEAEAARKRAEEELAKARAKAREAEEARKAREAEQAHKMQEAEAARKRAEAELAKAQAKAREAELEHARQAEKAAAAKAAATAEQPKMSREEVLRMRSEDREKKYQEAREHQRLEHERMETSMLMTSLVDSVNHAYLERGRNLIADLSAGRKLTRGQADMLDYAKTYMDHLEKAQNGNADAMLWIGNQYYTVRDSLGIVKNPPLAFDWYRKAAMAGSAQAYYFMSLMTEQGEGCRKDVAQSGRYCLKAARLGNAEAMFWTGVYFKEGTHGFEKSPSTAFKFLSMARNTGFENPNLDKMIRLVQGESDGDTIDSWFPEDPLQEPVKPKDEKPWWKLGIL